MQLDSDRLHDELGLRIPQADALALTLLAKAEGFGSVGDMLSHAATDSVAPGWCVTCCEPAGECEPDARGNYCEFCGKQDVRSCLVLAGII